MHLAAAGIDEATVPMNTSVPRPESNAAEMANDLILHPSVFEEQHRNSSTPRNISRVTDFTPSPAQSAVTFKGAGNTFGNNFSNLFIRPRQRERQNRTAQARPWGVRD
jgi:hypothetical protein